MQVKIALTLALSRAASAVRLAVQPKDYIMAMETKVHARPHDNECRDLRSPMMCAAKPGQDPWTAAAVVSTFQEDIHWINEMPWSDQLSVLVHNRTTARTHVAKLKDGRTPWSGTDSLVLAEEAQESILALNSRRTTPVEFVGVPNEGDEAAAYLTWIIDHYDSLPDVTFFLQGHRCASHANFDMAAVLPNIRQCFSPKQGYMDLNTYHEGGQTKCKETRKIIDVPIQGFHLEHFGAIWSNLFEKHLGAMPTRICWDSYAQFAVSRDAIRRHPVEFYRTLHDGVLRGITTMEFFWRAVFVPSAISHTPPPKRDRMGKVIKKAYEFSPEEILENSRVIDLAGQERYRPGGL